MSAGPGVGTCNEETTKCTCEKGYATDDCSGTPCPGDCGGNGVCDFTKVCSRGSLFFNTLFFFYTLFALKNQH